MSACWFGWCDSAAPIITEAPGNGSGHGTSGKCVVYQPQEYKIFGITFGSRNQESMVDCQAAF